VVSVYAASIAASLLDEAKLFERKAAVLNQAENWVRELELHIQLPNPEWAVYNYYLCRGERGRALDIAMRAFEQSRSPIVAAHCMILLYEQEKFNEALQCYEKCRQPDAFIDVLRAFVLAELPDGAQKALERYEVVAKKYPQEGENL